MNDNFQDQMMIPGVQRPPGRPRNPDALNDAARSRNYRQRLQASGFRQVFLHLPKELVTVLDRLASERGCNRSQVTCDLLRVAMRESGALTDAPGASPEDVDAKPQVR